MICKTSLIKKITVAIITTQKVHKVRSFEVYIENTPDAGLEYPSKILLNYSYTIVKELRLITRLGQAALKLCLKLRRFY